MMDFAEAKKHNFILIEYYALVSKMKKMDFIRNLTCLHFARKNSLLGYILGVLANTIARKR